MAIRKGGENRSVETFLWAVKEAGHSLKFCPCLRRSKLRTELFYVFSLLPAIFKNVFAINQTLRTVVIWHAKSLFSHALHTQERLRPCFGKAVGTILLNPWREIHD